MLCPVCGRSDGLCDCLVAAAPGQANDGADVAGPTSGLGISAPSQDWADTLLQFVREFAAASPNVAPPATAGHSPSPVGQTAAADSAAGSLPATAANAQTAPASAGSLSPGSSAAPPLRIAPFVTAPAAKEGAQDRSSASSGSAARPGTTNTAWSGGSSNGTRRKCPDGPSNRAELALGRAVTAHHTGGLDDHQVAAQLQ